MEGSDDPRKLAIDFLTFINESVTHFHAVETSKRLLRAFDFIQVQETDVWKLERRGRYFFTRNHSTIVAFVIGGEYKAGNGANIIGAHTDSPNLKVKPTSKRERKGCLQVDVETYGGGLWHTWFDRDLTLAGRVVVEVGGKFEHRLVHIPRPILRIPNLAIHLQSADERSAFKFNPQTHLGFPILATTLKEQLNATKKQDETNHHTLVLELIAKELKVDASAIRDMELSVIDTQPSCLGGAFEEFIFSPRLDNLFMSYCSLMGLVNSLPSVSIEPRVRIVALFDNEEIGSVSANGAASSLMPQVLERIFRCLGADHEGVQRAYRQSFLISADMAHATHPNYPEKHEENHEISLHKGVVLKYNANQRYATTSVTAFLLKELARRNNVPIQEFVVRNDSPCGSTIGPILSAECGVRTIDVGCPQLAMHSIREMAAVDDVSHAINLFSAFYKSFTGLDESLAVDK